eukprot:256197_1
MLMVNTSGNYSYWGESETEWWSNMTTIPGLCDGAQTRCSSYNNTPDATLLIQFVDDDTLIGQYMTTFEVEVNNQTTWYNNSYQNNDNVSDSVTFSCISTLTFNQTNKYAHQKEIYHYDVNITDWYCDMFGLDDSLYNLSQWECMVSLPQTMNAIVLDPTFQTAMLFDDSWCNVFPLTKRDGYTFNPSVDDFSQISVVWFGSLHCDNLFPGL